MEIEILRAPKITKNAQKTDFPVFYVTANSQEIIFSFFWIFEIFAIFSPFWPPLPPIRANFEDFRI